MSDRTVDESTSFPYPGAGLGRGSAHELDPSLCPGSFAPVGPTVPRQAWAVKIP